LHAAALGGTTEIIIFRVLIKFTAAYVMFRKPARATDRDNVFIEGDLLTLDAVVGVVDDVIPSNCRAGDSPPPDMRSLGNGNDMRVSP
jgi:hypothetical protein